MAVNPAVSKFALALLYSIIPAMFKFIAIPFMWRYPLTEERQREIRAGLERQRAETSSGGVVLG